MTGSGADAPIGQAVHAPPRATICPAAALLGHTAGGRGAGTELTAEAEAAGGVAEAGFLKHVGER
jgi:hypothetical protein